MGTSWVIFSNRPLARLPMVLEGEAVSASSGKRVSIARLRARKAS